MDNNLEIIQEEIEIYKDTLVIDGDKIVILRDYVDGDIDYYYLFQNLKGQLYQCSCVGGFISLKDQLSSSEYKKLVKFFQVNQEACLRIQNREVK